MQALLTNILQNHWEWQEDHPIDLECVWEWNFVRYIDRTHEVYVVE